MCSVGLSCVCLCLFWGVSGLLNHGQVSPAVTAYPGDIWKELYGFKKQLDTIQKENQELKTNQSQLLSQIKQKQNMSTYSSTDIQKLHTRLERLENENYEIKMNQSALSLEMERQTTELKDNETMLRLEMKALETENEELRKNQTLFRSAVTDHMQKELVNLTHYIENMKQDFGHMNNSFVALSSVQKATTSLVTTLQGEQIANKLGISGLQEEFE